MADNTIKSSGGDYTSATAWEADLSGTLTEVERAICFDLDDADVTIAGFTTTAAFYAEMVADSSARCNGVGRDNSGVGYRLSATGSDVALNSAVEHVRFIGFEITADSGAPSVVRFDNGSYTSGSDVRMSDMIVLDQKTSASTAHAIDASKSNLNLTMINMVVAGKGRPWDTRSALSVTADHIVCFTDAAALGPISDTELTATNFASFGYSSECFWTGGASPSGSHNAASDSSVSTDYTNVQASLTTVDQFTNPTISSSTLDFTLKSGNSLKDNGTGSLTNDIAETAYPSPSDIGVFSSDAGGGGVTVEPVAGALVFTGLAPVIINPKTVDPGLGSISFTGQIPTVNIGAAVVVEPGTGAVLFTGLTPEILTPAIVEPTTGAIVFAGLVPAILEGAEQIVIPGLGAISFAGLAPSVLTPNVVEPGLGSMAFTGLVPSIIAGVTITPQVGSISITGQAPSIDISANIEVIPGTGALSFNGLNPVILAINPITITPGAGAITLTGKVPSIFFAPALAAGIGAGIFSVIDDSTIGLKSSINGVKIGVQSKIELNNKGGISGFSIIGAGVISKID